MNPQITVAVTGVQSGQAHGSHIWNGQVDPQRKSNMTYLSRVGTAVLQCTSLLSQTIYWTIVGEGKLMIHYSFPESSKVAPYKLMRNVLQCPLSPSPPLFHCHPACGLRGYVSRLLYIGLRFKFIATIAMVIRGQQLCCFDSRQFPLKCYCCPAYEGRLIEIDGLNKTFTKVVGEKHRYKRNMILFDKNGVKCFSFLTVEIKMQKNNVLPLAGLVVYTKCSRVTFTV